MRTPEEYAAEIAIAAANLSSVTDDMTTLGTLLSLANHIFDDITNPSARDPATADLFGDDNGTDNDHHNH